MSVDLECEAAVTARTRCGWVSCLHELCNSSNFLYVLWCLRDNEMEILQMTESSMVSAMCGGQLRDKKASTGLMLMFGFKETIDQFAMANSVHWYGHVLRSVDGHVWRREDGHVLRRALDFEFEGEEKKRTPKGHRLRKKA